jgi:hypothetical protein
VPELTARHRRKAGSGPPANALIAWIGADPHLRTVAASHRRRTAASLPSNTLAAKAAAAACFALAGGGILSITAIVNDGLVAPVASSPSPILSQDAGPSPAPASGPVAGVQPRPRVFPAPVATRSMVASRQAPQPIVAPDVPTPSRHIAADGPSTSPRRNVSPKHDVSSSEAGPAHTVAPRRADTLQPDRPIAPIQLAAAGKPGLAGTLANSPDADDSAVPTEPGKPAGSDTKPGGEGKPVAAGGGAEPVAADAADRDEAKHGSAIFSPKSAPAHGSISADGPSPRAPSTAGQKAALHQVSPRH